MITKQKSIKIALMTFWLLMFAIFQRNIFAEISIPFNKDNDSYSQQIDLLSKRITSLHNVLQKLLKVKDFEYIYLPGDLKVNKENNYFEMEIVSARDINHRYKSRNEQESRFLRLHFNGDKLTKVDAKIIVEDLSQHKSSIVVIEDNQPASENKDHVVIQKLEFNSSTSRLLSPQQRNGYDLSNLTGQYTKTLAKDLPISATKHGKIDMMREFYIPHIRDFIHKMKIIAGLHEPIQSQNDHMMIETLKSSLKED